MQFDPPSVEEQERLVEEAMKGIRAAVNEFFPKTKEEHKLFRLMVKKMLPVMMNNPASPSTRYHSAWAGGLLAHTWAVIETGMAIEQSLRPLRPGAEPHSNLLLRQSVIKCGFLHDLGKIGDGEHPYYLEQDNDWRAQNLGELYTIERDLNVMPYLPVPQRAVWLAYEYGVHLTQEEVQAIIASDGPGSAQGKQVIATFLETPLTMIIHFADKWASQARGI